MALCLVRGRSGSSSGARNVPPCSSSCRTLRWSCWWCCPACRWVRSLRQAGHVGSRLWAQGAAAPAPGAPTPRKGSEGATGGWPLRSPRCACALLLRLHCRSCALPCTAADSVRQAAGHGAAAHSGAAASGGRAARCACGTSAGPGGGRAGSCRSCRRRSCCRCRAGRCGCRRRARWVLGAGCDALPLAAGPDAAPADASPAGQPASHDHARPNPGRWAHACLAACRAQSALHGLRAPFAAAQRPGSESQRWAACWGCTLSRGAL